MHHLIRNRFMSPIIALFLLIISANSSASIHQQSLRVIRDDNDLVIFLKELERSLLMAKHSPKIRSERLTAGLRHLEQNSKNLSESSQLENLNFAIIDTEFVLRSSLELVTSNGYCEPSAVFEQFDVNNAKHSDDIQTLPAGLRGSYSRLIRAACGKTPGG
jgi:hypothetical protein